MNNHKHKVQMNETLSSIVTICEECGKILDQQQKIPQRLVMPELEPNWWQYPQPYPYYIDFNNPKTTLTVDNGLSMVVDYEIN